MIRPAGKPQSYILQGQSLARSGEGSNPTGKGYGQEGQIRKGFCPSCFSSHIPFREVTMHDQADKFL